MFSKKSLPKIAVLFIALLLYFTEATDADLVDKTVISGNTYKATTLDFSNRSTVSNGQKGFLFNTNGLVSGGFDVQSVRIKKDGELNFKYSVAVYNTSGNSDLCSALVIKVFKDWDVIYNGSLLDLRLDQEIGEGGVDDYIFVVALDSASLELSNKQCNFDIKFVTQSEGVFSDEEILQNQVLTSSR